MRIKELAEETLKKLLKMRNKSFILLATCYIGFLQSFGLTLDDTKSFVDAITIYLNQYEDSLNINHIECDTPDYYEFFGEVLL